MTTDLAKFIIDTNDEDCPECLLHVAAYEGKVGPLQELLSDEDVLKKIDTKIRPFSATPLRLAATGAPSTHNRLVPTMCSNKISNTDFDCTNYFLSVYKSTEPKLLILLY